MLDLPVYLARYLSLLGAASAAGAAARAPPRLGLATAPAGLLSCLCLGGADEVEETVTI